MAKYADKYFLTDEWKIIEKNFDPSYSEVAESVFSLANEYMGIRGYFEEGYSGKRLLGSYFNGIYEEKKQAGQGYKGVVDITEFMVNSVDWLYTRITLDDEVLDLGISKCRDFERVLDMRSGLLIRSFIWQTEKGKELKLTFERLVSMKNNGHAAQRITICPLNFSGEVKLISGLDFGTVHKSAEADLWNCISFTEEKDYLGVLGETVNTRQCVYSSCSLKVPEEVQVQRDREEKKIFFRIVLPLQENKEAVVSKSIWNVVSGKGLTEDFKKKCECAGEKLAISSFEEILEENKDWWQGVWDRADIEIEGDELNQQGIRFCIFQMFQTYHGAVEGTNIGAKGLTGEAYNGNAFWDTETYCLPFFLFNDAKAAKNLLLFRYLTLPEAKKRAKALDCEGAFYPVATISGKECCNLWQHASLQMQASTAVAYGIWIYEKITGDEDFMAQYGLEMLAEICRMLATRGAFFDDGTKYGYFGVMGPDEFQMMVNNNCYTNFMAKFTFNYTLDSCKRIKKEQPDAYKVIAEKLDLKEEEFERWKTMAECMYLPYDKETRLFEQHDGYFRLPHIDVDEIPVEDFPLYHHWSYDRIYRNDMIKQPDVLMFLLLFNSGFDEKVLRANYEYYEPRCIHESSLSPSVHSILASQLKKKKEAYDFFQFATRMDLDNYNRNSNEGIHTTSIAAAWMNIVYGFGGIRSDGEKLKLCPTLPEKWESYSFRLSYQSDVLMVKVNQDSVTIASLNGKDIQLELYGNLITVKKEPQSFEIPQVWRE